MTCKEYVNKYYPELTEPEMFCPFNFGLSVNPYSCKIQCIERVNVELLPEVRNKICFECWNQPAKYHGKYIMKVKVTK